MSYVLALYGGGRHAGIGAVVCDAEGCIQEQATLFSFGQATKRFEAIGLFAKWIAQYAIDIVAVGNGVMFHDIDRLLRLLASSYRDMPIHRIAMDETHLEKGLSPVDGAKMIARDSHQALKRPLKWPKKTPGVTTLNDLKEGMMLEGMVIQIRPFGAFTDIGIGLLGLIPSRGLPKDISVGKVVSVKVNRVDTVQRQVGLYLQKAKPKSPIKSAKPPINPAMANALNALKRG